VNRWVQPSLAVGAVAFVLTACGRPRAAERSPEDLAGYTLATPLPKPDFTLTGTDGKPFAFRKATDGYLTLVFFGYTNCPDVCPVHLSNLGAVMPALDPAVARRVKVVFVSTDPRRDTPGVLRAWLDHFDPDFIGMTGDSAVIATAEQALQLAPAVVERAAPGDTGYTVGHSSLVVAFTPDNLARVVYPYGTRQEDWVHDLPKLAGASR
jgi:protein SCO1/2